ncbi:MAG: TonB-dependent receptor [Gammaproteobacteria bacterium]
MSKKDLDTYHKALTFNMDVRPYGTIAEIGAGQETVRWFFKVGGAAGSIAKAMSAYDMKFSDTIYGPCKRYVSRERLQSMLDKEYTLVDQRLGETRGSNCTFFAFANTVSTFSHTQQQAGHGWLGIRFQTEAQAPASQIDLHVVLKGQSNTQDQDTLGVLGVNLIYGAHYLYQNPVELLVSLMDQLGQDLLEIDMVDFEGPAFETVDNRLMALRLVQLGLTKAAMFQANGKLVQPADALYKKAVLVERSRFRPPTHLTINMLDCAYESFCQEPDINPGDVVVLSEMTLSNLDGGDDIDVVDFLHRVEILCALGKNVMISDYGEFYRLAQYLFKQTSKPVAIALGIPTLKLVFDEHYYEDLEGGILESFGRLFRNDMRMFVCPTIDNENGKLITASNLQVPQHLSHLYQHLLENRYIRELNTVEHSHLSIHADNVLEKIRNDDTDWKSMVPSDVVEIISDRGFFKSNNQ